MSASCFVALSVLSQKNAFNLSYTKLKGVQVRNAFKLSEEKSSEYSNHLNTIDLFFIQFASAFIEGF